MNILMKILDMVDKIYHTIVKNENKENEDEDENESEE